MDVRVTDGVIEPLKCRITPGKAVPLSTAVELGPMDDHGRLLAYTDREISDITKALDALGVGAIILTEDQPDPTLLAACQGKLHSRSQALAALATGKAPITLEAIAADVEQLKLAKAEPIQEAL